VFTTFRLDRHSLGDVGGRPPRYPSWTQPALHLVGEHGDHRVEEGQHRHHLVFGAPSIDV
jgi:hypothetical protein